jgi:hypothetical protein
MLASSKKFIAAIAATACVNSFANEKDCNDLRSRYLSPSLTQSALQELQSLVQADNSCAKNTLGIMYAQGMSVKKDFLRAYSIFYDMSQKDYPPSQLNLAIVLAGQDDHNPETLLNYLAGLTIKYMRSREWGHIGTSARDFARKYLSDRLAGPAPDANLIKLQEEFEENLRFGMREIHVGFQAKIREQKEFEDTVVSIIAIGMMAHKLASVRAAPSAPPVFSPAAPPPLPRFYHLTPLGGNMVYAFPIY